MVARIAVPLAVLAVLAADPTRAHAATKKECADAYVAGQASRDTGALSAARDQLSVCASDSCPRVLRGDCIEWLRQVVDRLPSIVVRAVDGERRDVQDALVAIDSGQPIAVNGRPIPLDPGTHTVTVTARGTSASERVVLAEGEKGRIVLVALALTAPVTPAASATTVTPVASLPAPEAPARSPRPMWPAFVVGGLGLAAFGGAGVFYAMGFDEGASLRERCGTPPSCSTRDTDAAHEKLIVGDVLVGLGLVAVGVATYLIVTSPRKSSPSSLWRPFTPARF